METQFRREKAGGWGNGAEMVNRAAEEAVRVRGGERLKNPGAKC